MCVYVCRIEKFEKILICTTPPPPPPHRIEKKYLL